MTKPVTATGQWLSSTAARKRLKITSCELMHRRQKGLLTFKKQGNGYFYWFED